MLSQPVMAWKKYVFLKSELTDILVLSNPAASVRLPNLAQSTMVE